MPEKTAWHITRGEVTRVQQRPAPAPRSTSVLLLRNLVVVVVEHVGGQVADADRQASVGLSLLRAEKVGSVRGLFGPV